MRNTTFRRVMLGSALSLLVGVLHAGSVDVAPVNASLSVDHSIQGFTVHNNSQSPETVQVSLMNWQQDKGQDVLTQANDLLATPPLFTVMPGKTQIIRVGLRQAQAKETEAAYRMFLTEVPPPPQPGFVGLAVTFRLSIPIFVKPEKSAPSELAWHITRGANNSLNVEVSNSGNSHVKITGITLEDKRTNQQIAQKDTLLYVLASKFRSLTMPSRGDVRSGDTVAIHAKTVDGDIDANAVVQSG